VFSNVQIKDGAVVAGGFYINHIIRAAQIAMYGICEVVITSGRDGKHGEQSYHYQDRALDLRLWKIAPDDRAKVAASIRALLPAYYDVVIEADHFHIEADKTKEMALKGVPT